MKNLLLLLIVLLTTSCATFTVSTLNHDPIYDDENYYVVENNVNVDTLNEFQFRNKLRTDFNFRYDFAQYALRQPSSFDWNNRVLGNRYNFYSPYGFGYNSYWNRGQMWMDWVWGYDGWNSWGSPHRWSPFGYDRWGYNLHYGWNNHGWGYNGYYSNGWNYYGWNNYGQNNWYGRRGRNNVSYVNGRRGSTMSIRDRIGQGAMIESTKPRVNVTKPRVNNTRPRVNVTKPRVNNTRPVINNSRPVNNTRPVINNSRPVNNTRPIINNSRPTVRPSRTNKVDNRRKD